MSDASRDEPEPAFARDVWHTHWAPGAGLPGGFNKAAASGSGRGSLRNVRSTYDVGHQSLGLTASLARYS
jgi:hypothetical protein